MGLRHCRRDRTAALLVDATDFFLRDIHGAAGGLRPGTYRVDRNRSAFYLPNTKGFPKNTEVDVTLTFGNDAGGRRAAGSARSRAPRQSVPPAGGGGGGFGGNLFSGTVASVTPTADSVTLREHVSFVELPDGNYTPRVDDPRAGYGGLSFVDYSIAIGEPMVFRYLRRHRLREEGPGARRVSEPVEPIRYWVDSGAPEDVRKALIEGAHVVEPGVRSRRLPQRLQGGGAARGRRPDGHPLQHDQLGAPLDPRLELGRQRGRPAHGRDHQGHGDARARCATARTT